MKNNSLTYFYLIFSIILICLIIFLFNRRVKDSRSERYQPEEEKEEKKIGGIGEALRALVYQDIPPNFANLARDVLMFGVLPDLTFDELNQLYTVDKTKRRQINQFIDKYYGLGGGLGDLGRLIKTVIPEGIATLEDLIIFATTNKYNKRVTDLYIRDQFEVNNLDAFSNLVAWKFGGNQQNLGEILNNKREDASAFLILFLEEIFTTLGAKFVKIRQTEDGEFILFADVSNLRPEVNTRDTYTIADLRSIPFIFTTMQNGLITLLRDPTSVEAVNKWNLIIPIIERAIIQNQVNFNQLTGNKSIKFINDPAHFSIQPFNLDLPQNTPIYRIFFGDFILEELNSEEIYELLRNTRFSN